MKRLLVTGSSGFLGWTVCQVAKETYDVYGTYSTHSVSSSNISLLKCDLTNFKAVKELFSQLKPDAVLHLAAQSKPNFCQVNPQVSYQINVSATLNLASLCAESAIAFLFTSTDLVFSGKNSSYQESDAVSPINIYGQQKAEAEAEILKIHSQGIICRMPLMFGLPSPVATSFIQGFLKILESGQTLSLFRDEYRTPVSSLTAAKGILLALENCQGEILHLGGKERISRYEFGCLMADVLGLSLAQITPCQQADVKMAAPRPADVSLDSSKAFSLGYQPQSIREELLQFNLGRIKT